MDPGLCAHRNDCEKKGRWRPRDSDLATAGRCMIHLKGEIDSQNARKDIWWAAEYYQRQSPHCSMLWRWGGWWSWGQWHRTWRGWKTEWGWQTSSGDEYDWQYSTAPHVEASAHVDEDIRIDPTRMGGCGKPLPWERYQVWDSQVEGSGSH